MSVLKVVADDRRVDSLSHEQSVFGFARSRSVCSIPEANLHCVKDMTNSGRRSS